MEIKLLNVGKRYRKEWILRHINIELNTSNKYAVTGPNGAGKSTFLKMLSGHLSPSKGGIQFFVDQQQIPTSEIFKHLSFAAPYIELIEEFTLAEAIAFHRQFKPLLPNLSTEALIEITGLSRHKNLSIAQFSSGMRQRVKLALAICTESQLILLDEPTTNLDDDGVVWYLNLIEQYTANRLLVVASNVTQDYQFCTANIDIQSFKTPILNT